MTAPFLEISKSNHSYGFFQKLFYDNWTEPTKSAQVKSIFGVAKADLDASYRGRRFNDYVQSSRSYTKIRFHGTRRSCRFGESEQMEDLCSHDDCGLCGILRHSFKLPKTEADAFSHNHHVRSNFHAVIVCRVAGRYVQYLKHACERRTAPDPGYDLVKALTVREGGDVLNPETVVYREDAIIPVAVILYTRKGWRPS
ncbi:hypothetical protein FDECE_9655 [Fusarium decemcellulare]|nr:hypothetical protein FDECE_9655 [Fusarium decemcellulare]